MKAKTKYLLILICFCVLVSGCGGMPEKLVIGMAPYNNPAKLINDFKPVKDYLQKEMGVTIEVTVPVDYFGLVDAMRQKKVDIGFYGPFSYIAGEREVNLEPLVVQCRKGSGTVYYSTIITRSDSGIKDLEDLKGKRFAFVESGSTSGFVMPFALFKSRDIDINQYFGSIKYSGTHDSVAMDVINRVTDAGAMDDIVFAQMLEDKEFNPEDINIIWKSEPIPASPYVARADLDSRLKAEFKTAMLTLHEKAPDILRSYDANAEKYEACSSSTYNSIRNVAEILGDEFMIEKFLKQR